MEVQPPDLDTSLTTATSLNVSILTIIQICIDFSEGIEFGGSFISDIIINSILLLNIFISYFFGKQFSFVKRVILVAMCFVLYLSNMISGYLCRSPLSNSSLIGVYNFTLFMRIPLLVLYMIFISPYLFS